MDEINEFPNYSEFLQIIREHFLNFKSTTCLYASEEKQLILLLLL